MRLCRADKLDVLVEQLGWKLDNHEVLTLLRPAASTKHAAKQSRAGAAAMPPGATLSMLAFPGTRGAPYIDALLSDK